MEKHNKNYQRIDQNIRDAFIKIATEKESKKITVTEICTAANVNRTTFYKHYKGVWEIGSTIQKEVIDQIFEIFLQFYDKKYLSNSHFLVDNLNNSIKSNVDYYHRIFQVIGTRYFFDELIEYIQKNLVKNSPIAKMIDTSEPMKTASFFLVGGLVNVYFEWFSGMINLTLDEIAQFLYAVVDKYVSVIINEEKVLDR